MYFIFPAFFAPVAVKNIKTVSQYSLLSEIGMDSIMSVEIRQILERDFNIFFTARDIRNLNFAKLAEIRDKNVKWQKTQEQEKEQETEVSGMRLLIQTVHNESITPEICMELPSKKDPRKIGVFLLPGIEGYGHIFNSMASKIKPRITCLQYGTNNIKPDLTSIPEYADYLLQVRVQGGCKQMEINFLLFLFQRKR